MTDEIDEVLKSVCFDISNRYDIAFIEIGTDADHVHFLIQTVPTMSPTQLVGTIKSITAREIFARAPSVKKKLWGGHFWSAGFFVNTVSRHGSEETIRKYVADQGKAKEYKQLHVQQLELY